MQLSLDIYIAAKSSRPQLTDQLPGGQVIYSASVLTAATLPKLWSKTAKSLPEQHKSKLVFLHSPSPSVDELFLRPFLLPVGSNYRALFIKRPKCAQLKTLPK